MRQVPAPANATMPAASARNGRNTLREVIRGGGDDGGGPAPANRRQSGKSASRRGQPHGARANARQSRRARPRMIPTPPAAPPAPAARVSATRGGLQHEGRQRHEDGASRPGRWRGPVASQTAAAGDLQCRCQQARATSGFIGEVGQTGILYAGSAVRKPHRSRADCHSGRL